MQLKHLAIGTVFFVFTLLVGACGDEKTRLKTGDPAPAFSLPVLDGNGVADFPEDYLGKVVALRFWADWCPYCDQEMRNIEPVYQKYWDQGLVILALNVHQDRATAKKFVARLHISYDVLLDIQGKTAADYQIIGLPTTYIIDRNGRINTKIVGESPAKVFDRVVGDLIREQPTTR